MSTLVFEEETYKILGACIQVHKKLGCGFSAPIYREALAKELTAANIPYVQKKKLPVFYKGTPLKDCFEADFVCYDTIILEIKSLGTIPQNLKQQVLQFLKATQLQIGYLVNFGEQQLTWKRYINT